MRRLGSRLGNRLGRMLQQHSTVNCVAAMRVRAQLPKPRNCASLATWCTLLLPLLMANVLLVLVIISAVRCTYLQTLPTLALSLLSLSAAIKINFKLKRLI